MNYDDVFQKSDVGRREIKSQHLGVLPREARTLLIMIDGKRTYESYLKTLNDSKMFADFGGIEPLFDLLLELECIEVEGGAARSPSQAATISQTSAAQASNRSQPSDASVEKEFERTFNSNASNDNRSSSETTPSKKSIGSIFKPKVSDSNYEAIKSELATYIEKNAPATEGWGYLLNLEQCENSTQLLSLVQDIQSTSSSSLSRGMNEFVKKIQAS